VTELADARAQKNSQRATLRKQKGWIGFVHGYKERCKIFDKVWDDIDWNEDEGESGCKEVETTPFKKIYKF
jgi:hypothetical protein